MSLCLLQLYNRLGSTEVTVQTEAVDTRRHGETEDQRTFQMSLINRRKHCNNADESVPDGRVWRERSAARALGWWRLSSSSPHLEQLCSAALFKSSQGLKQSYTRTKLDLSSALFQTVRLLYEVHGADEPCI